MSTTNNSEMEDRAVTIVETFEASEIPALQGISPEQVDQKLQSLLTYQVPMAEAERVVVRSYLEDAELNRDDLPGSVADLAGFAPQPGHSFDRVMIETIDEDSMWCDLLVEVVELWEPRSESIAQVGLIGDESGVIKFVKWASAELPELEEGQTYTFQNVVSDEYEGRYSVGLNSATSVDPSDESIDASDGTVEASGTIVDIQDGSGLIKRCPHEDCTRVLQNGRCAEHGQVDGEFDLRIKAILDDGSQAVNVIFDAEATTAVTGLSMEEAKQLAMDALSTDVVEAQIRERVLGRTYRLSGPVVGTFLLVDEAEEAPGAELGLDAPALGPAVSRRQAAKRVLAQEFNAATYSFKESDEDRAPRYTLLPTGEAVNRVFVAGTLVETEDVGQDSEYWKGRLIAGTESVFVYAGRYQPDAMAALRAAETPSYVVVVGKPRTYEAGDYTNVSIQPEAVVVVDAATRDAWVDAAVRDTRARLDGFEQGIAEYADRAREVYGDDVSSIEAAVEELSEGDSDAVTPSPDEDPEGEDQLPEPSP